MLTDGSRVALPRQRTLLATMDWGHELLSEGERALFRRISAFSNGFTLEAAEEVCSEGGVERGEVLELLGRLVDKSLVLVETRGDDARYRMLESVGQYASRKLEGSGEEGSVRSRHAGFFLRLAERAEPALSGPDQGTWIDRLDVEVGNLRAAMSWFRTAEDKEAGLRLANALWGFCHARGYYGMGRAWLEDALATSGDPTSLRAGALRGAGLLAFLQCDYIGAREHLGHSLSLYKDLADRCGVAGVKDVLGGVAREQGDYGRARKLHEESLAISREGGYREGVGWALNQLGMVAYHRGDLERAGRYLRESLAVHEDLGDLGRVASVLEALAEAAAARKRFEPSARLFGAAEVLRETIGVPAPPCESPEYDSALAAVRTRVGDKEFSLLRAEGRSMKLEAAVSLALEPDPAPPTATAQDLLSARETEVLGLVAEGLTDQEVAQRLYLSPRTVGQHLSSVYRKLGVRSRTAATHEATEKGILK